MRIPLNSHLSEDFNRNPPYKMKEDDEKMALIGAALGFLGAAFLASLAVSFISLGALNGLIVLAIGLFGAWQGYMRLPI